MWRIFVEFVQRARRLEGEKEEEEEEKEEEEESVVKYKSADVYVGRPNNTICRLI